VVLRHRLQAIRWAATFALGAAVLGLIAAAIALSARARRPLLVAVAGLLVGLVVAIPPVNLWRRGAQLPYIRDISTDVQNPPLYVAVVPLRKGARNPIDYKPETADEQKRGYPGLVPLILRLPPQQAFLRADSAARAMGWEVVAASPRDLRIEATDTTLLFGFKDDVVIRILPHPDGSPVEVRSLSRVGGSDFGVNAQRIRDFMKRLAAA